MLKANAGKTENENEIEEDLEEKEDKLVAAKNEGNNEVSALNRPEPEPSPVVEEKQPPQLTLKRSYSKDQWSPLNPEGKKKYDRQFLMDLRLDPLCIKKPDELPDVVIKSCSDNVGPQLAQAQSRKKTPKRGSQQGSKKGSRGVIQMSLSLNEEVKLKTSENEANARKTENEKETELQDQLVETSANMQDAEARLKEMEGRAAELTEQLERERASAEAATLKLATLKLATPVAVQSNTDIMLKEKKGLSQQGSKMAAHLMAGNSCGQGPVPSGGAQTVGPGPQQSPPPSQPTPTSTPPGIHGDIAKQPLQPAAQMTYVQTSRSMNPIPYPRNTMPQSQPMRTHVDSYYIGQMIQQQTPAISPVIHPVPTQFLMHHGQRQATLFPNQMYMQQQFYPQQAANPQYFSQSPQASTQQPPVTMMRSGIVPAPPQPIKNKQDRRQRSPLKVINPLTNEEVDPLKGKKPHNPLKVINPLSNVEVDPLEGKKPHNQLKVINPLTNEEVDPLEGKKPHNPLKLINPLTNEEVDPLESNDSNNNNNITPTISNDSSARGTPQPDLDNSVGPDAPQASRVTDESDSILPKTDRLHIPNLLRERKKIIEKIKSEQMAEESYCVMKKVSDTLDKEKDDEYDVFGKNVANQLRKLNSKLNKAEAKFKINQLLYKYELKELSSHSCPCSDST